MNNDNNARTQLLESLAELEERLVKIKENVTHAEQPLSNDFAEQATEMENSEVVDYLGNSTQKEIIQIKQAIQRIDNDEYGLCLECGEEISEARLKALPFAEFCIRCAQKKENV